jgi:hypothetical protein
MCSTGGKIQGYARARETKRPEDFLSGPAIIQMLRNEFSPSSHT